MKLAGRNPRGFATVTALVALSLVGITIAGLMRHFSGEAVRTQEEMDRVQLQQMVIAGSQSRAASPLRLPDELTTAGGRIVLQFGANNAVAVNAEINKRHLQYVGDAR